MATINGTNSNETINGSAANDIIRGLGGRDNIGGGDGNDTLNGDSGNDTLEGSLGNDSLNGGSEDDRLNGGLGIDRLEGGDGDDDSAGSEGSDSYVYGLAWGQDTIDEYDFDGTVDVDRLLFGPGITLASLKFLVVADSLIISRGADTLQIDNQFAAASTGYRVEQLRLDDGTTISLSSPQASWLVRNGTGSGDRLYGSIFNDTINGLGGADSIDADAGNDTVNAGTGDDFARGGDGNDALNGGSENDTLYGDAGLDILDGGDGDDFLFGGTDIDTASYASSAIGVTVSLVLTGNQDTIGAGFDRLSAIENLTGSKVADNLDGDALANRLRGEGGNDNLAGAGGNDLLSGGLGNDVLDGGEGSDTADFGRAAAAVTVSLALTGAQLTGEGSDRLISIEQLRGSIFNDTLRGDALANALYGGAGNDALFGLAGRDFLSGDTGNDTLTGGADIDTFRFSNANGTDRIVDFVHGVDKIAISDALIGTPDEALASAAQVGTATQITLPNFGAAGNTVIILENVQESTLTVADFIVIA